MVRCRDDVSADMAAPENLTPYSLRQRLIIQEYNCCNSRERTSYNACGLVHDVWLRPLGLDVMVGLYVKRHVTQSSMWTPIGEHFSIARIKANKKTYMTVYIYT